MIEITSPNLSALIARLGKAPAELASRALAAHRAIGLMLQSTIRLEKLSGQVLHVRSGKLAQAIFTKTTERPDGLTTVVGADLAKAPQARVQELGGTIRPRKAKRLAIPVGRALTPAGVARVSARTFMANPGALGFTSAWVSTLPGCAAILGQVGKGRGRHVETVFVLKSSVTLPPRSYLQSTAHEKRAEITATLDRVAEEIRRAIDA